VSRPGAFRPDGTTPNPCSQLLSQYCAEEVRLGDGQAARGSAKTRRSGSLAGNFVGNFVEPTTVDKTGFASRLRHSSNCPNSKTTKSQSSFAARRWPICRTSLVTRDTQKRRTDPHRTQPSFLVIRVSRGSPQASRLRTGTAPGELPSFFTGGHGARGAMLASRGVCSLFHGRSKCPPFPPVQDESDPKRGDAATAAAERPGEPKREGDRPPPSPLPSPPGEGEPLDSCENGSRLGRCRARSRSSVPSRGLWRWSGSGGAIKFPSRAMPSPPDKSPQRPDGQSRPPRFRLARAGKSAGQARGKAGAFSGVRALAGAEADAGTGVLDSRGAWVAHQVRQPSRSSSQV
jgi:hypothetical protein